MGQSFHPGSLAVLVVEDDALLRAEAVDLCMEAGFTTYEARSADQAIRILERHSEIRVLFTDIEMEGSMDGLRLAHAVRERWPPVAIMITSGRRNVTKEDLPEHGLFFAKPYPPDDIVKALNDIAAQVMPVGRSPA
jgi:CheY-like chemotaxis protein